MILLTQKLDEAQLDQIIDSLGSSTIFYIVIGIVFYLLTAMALFNLAKKRGYGIAWLSFVPVANFYVLGGIVDHINSFNRKKSNSKFSLLVLNGLSALFTILATSSIIKAFTEFGKSEATGIESLSFPYLLTFLAILFYLISKVAVYIALHKVYSDYSQGKEVLLTLLTVFLGVYPIILFIIKNNQSQSIYYARQQALQEKEAIAAQEALMAKRHANATNGNNQQFMRPMQQQNPQGSPQGQVGRPMQVRNPQGQPMQQPRPQGNPQGQPMQQPRPQGNPQCQPMQQPRPQGNPQGQPMQQPRPQGNPQGQPMQQPRPQGNPQGQPMQQPRPQGNPQGQPIPLEMPRKIQPLQPMQGYQNEDFERETEQNGQIGQRNVYRTNRPLQQRPFVKKPPVQRPIPPMPPKERPEDAFENSSANPFQDEVFTPQMNSCDNECPPRTIYNAVKPIQSDRPERPAPQMPTMQVMDDEQFTPQMNSCDNECPPRTIYNAVKPIQSARPERPAPQLPTMQMYQNPDEQSEPEFDDEY